MQFWKPCNLSEYMPDYRYRNTTHYLVVNRYDDIVSHTGASKRDALFNADIYAVAQPGSGPYTIIRYTGTSGKLTRLDVISA